MVDTITLVKFRVRCLGTNKSKKSRQEGNGPKISSLITRKQDSNVGKEIYEKPGIFAFSKILSVRQSNLEGVHSKIAFKTVK